MSHQRSPAPGSRTALRSPSALVCALALVAAGCASDLPVGAADEQIDSDLEYAAESGSADDLQPPILGLHHDLQGLGEPLNFDFNADSEINRVLVALRVVLLRPGIAKRAALDMTITSINGVDHFHGSDIIPLVEVEPFAVDGRLVQAIVTWTEDHEPEVVGDVYTICSTLVIDLPGGTWYGPERCRFFPGSTS